MITIRKNLSEIPRGVRASVAFFMASVVSMGISYITTPLYTRLLTPGEYGQVSIFSTWVSILGILAMFNLAAGVFNNGMLDYPDKRDEYSFSMLILSNIITLVFFCLFLAVYPLVKPWIGLDFPLVILMGVLFLFQPAYSFWIAKQRYELKYKMTFIWSVISAIFSPAVAIICIFIFNDNRLYARIFGAEIALILIYVGFYIYISIKGKFRVQTKYWKGALLFNLPLLPHYLSIYILGSSDKLMISNLVSDSATAYYSVAYTVSSVAMVLWSAVNGSLVPYTYEKCKNKDYKSVSAVTIPILTVFATACIGVIMLAPEVVAIVATPDYSEAIYAIPPIVGGVFFQVHYSLYGNIIFYYKKPKYLTIATVVSATLNIILNYVFIRKFGYIAAGYTTLVCYFVQAALDYIVMRKIANERVYNMKYIGVLSAGVIAVSLLSNLIYAFAFVRYTILAVILIVCSIFRNKIFGVFKTMKS